jgi:translation initiation factor 2 subunit 1
MQVTKTVPAMTEAVKDALIKNIRRRMTPQPLKIRADIELKCFQFDGVLHIKVIQLFLFFEYFKLSCVQVFDKSIVLGFISKRIALFWAISYIYFIMFFCSLFQDAMRKAEAVGTEECPVKIKLVAPPLYVITTQTLDKV